MTGRDGANLFLFGDGPTRRGSELNCGNDDVAETEVAPKVMRTCRQGVTGGLYCVCINRMREASNGLADWRSRSLL